MSIMPRAVAVRSAPFLWEIEMETAYKGVEMNLGENDLLETCHRNLDRENAQFDKILTVAAMLSVGIFGLICIILAMVFA